MKFNFSKISHCPLGGHRVKAAPKRKAVDDAPQPKKKRKKKNSLFNYFSRNKLA